MPTREGESLAQPAAIATPRSLPALPAPRWIVPAIVVAAIAVHLVVAQQLVARAALSIAGVAIAGVLALVVAMHLPRRR
ncbi:MAG TPA: hypothetical protein VL328_11420 [Gemmatimonadaceae bacterium]|jgi:hypothetical protein|nr:hypothetical protein [Gemmatimonadaceae bacterium]